MIAVEPIYSGHLVETKSVWLSYRVPIHSQRYRMVKLPESTMKLHQSRMTAASKSACLLPRGLDRRIRFGAKFVPLLEIHSLSDRLKISICCLGRERKDKKPALTRLPFVSCFQSRVAALLSILVLDFQLHSSEEEDFKSPSVVILLGLVKPDANEIAAPIPTRSGILLSSLEQSLCSRLRSKGSLDYEPLMNLGPTYGAKKLALAFCMPARLGTTSLRFRVLGAALLVREESSCKPVHSYPIVSSIMIGNRVILSIPVLSRSYGVVFPKMQIIDDLVAFMPHQHFSQEKKGEGDLISLFIISYYSPIPIKCCLISQAIANPPFRLIESSKERQAKTLLVQEATEERERVVKEIQVVVSGQRNQGRNSFDLRLLFQNLILRPKYAILFVKKDLFPGPLGAGLLTFGHSD
ncbi:hypothetical protein H5410_055777 [Solanum commersonii]|uniref:Uncharacterized protein n=1 Tax=Solanum commersonii TaxID=4109 RepID=A0A9J5WIG9_SOLCO|nr:hypothetical protein H5410_055777 [Solanum commersonii]